MMPCNVVIEVAGRGTKVSVHQHDLVNDARFADLADDAARGLRAAIDGIRVSNMDPYDRRPAHEANAAVDPTDLESTHEVSST